MKTQQEQELEELRKALPPGIFEEVLLNKPTVIGKPPTGKHDLHELWVKLNPEGQNIILLGMKTPTEAIIDKVSRTLGRNPTEISDIKQILENVTPEEISKVIMVDTLPPPKEIKLELILNKPIEPFFVPQNSKYLNGGVQKSKKAKKRKSW